MYECMYVGVSDAAVQRDGGCLQLRSDSLAAGQEQDALRRFHKEAAGRRGVYVCIGSICIGSVCMYVY